MKIHSRNLHFPPFFRQSETNLYNPQDILTYSTYIIPRIFKHILTIHIPVNPRSSPHLAGAFGPLVPRSEGSSKPRGTMKLSSVFHICMVVELEKNKKTTK